MSTLLSIITLSDNALMNRHRFSAVSARISNLILLLPTECAMDESDFSVLQEIHTLLQMQAQASSEDTATFISKILSWDPFQALHNLLDQLGAFYCPPFPQLDAWTAAFDLECDRYETFLWLQSLDADAFDLETRTLYRAALCTLSPSPCHASFGPRLPLISDAEISIPFDATSLQPMPSGLYLFGDTRVAFRSIEKLALQTGHPRTINSLYPMVHLHYRRHPRFLNTYGMIDKGDSISVLVEYTEMTLQQWILQPRDRFALTTELVLIHMLEIVDGLQLLQHAFILPPRIHITTNTVYMVDNCIKLDPCALCWSPAAKDRAVRFPAAESLARILIELLTKQPVTSPLHQALTESPKIAMRIFEELIDPSHSGILPLTVIHARLIESLKIIASVADPLGSDDQAPLRDGIPPFMATTKHVSKSEANTDLAAKSNTEALVDPVAQDFYDSLSGIQIGTNPHTESTHSSNSGWQRILIGSSGMDNAIKFYDPTQPMNASVFEGHTSYVTGIALTPQAADRSLFASCSDDRTVKIWSLQRRSLVRDLLGHTDSVNFVNALSPHESSPLLISGSEDKTVRVWDSATGRCLRVFDGHPCAVYAGCWVDEHHVVSADSQYLWSLGPKIRLWDVTTGKCLMSLRGHSGLIFGLCSMRNPTSSGGNGASSSANMTFASSLVASCSGDFGGSDNTVRLWDLKSARQTAVLKGHLSNVRAVCPVADEPMIASCGWDKTVRLWDLRNNREVLMMRGHTDFVNTVVSVVKGPKKFLVSGGGDHIIRFWDILNGKEVLSVDNHTQSVLCLSASVI